MATIAIIGDIHGFFETADVTYFNQAEYDLLLFVGDLCSGVNPTETFEIAQLIAQLQKPALFIPGNHDIVNLLQLLAEIRQIHWLARLSGRRHVAHHGLLETCLGGATLGGYSIHSFTFPDLSLDVLVARPYAMGGPDLNFAPFLAKQFGVRTLVDSTALLKQRIDEGRADHLIVLAHCGPFGLGDQPTSIWGCDFKPEWGDWGDRDLAEAIAYAKMQGKQVLAVMGGHMHLQTMKGRGRFGRRGEPGPLRAWYVERDETHYINAACVPRIFNQDGQRHHHHVRLSITENNVAVEEILISDFV